MKTRIIIADDHRVFIDGMKALLKEFPEIEIVGEALNGNQLVELTLQLRPDVVITDVQMPEKDGIEATREICSQLPGMKIIAVNGRTWSSDVLHEAIASAKTSSVPIELVVENGSFTETYRVNYHGGERYPHLERDNTKPDLLGDIIKSRAQRTSD